MLFLSYLIFTSAEDRDDQLLGMIAIFDLLFTPGVLLSLGFMFKGAFCGS